MEAKINILVIEDEKAVTSALNLKLQKEGFGVTCVADGQAALEALEREKIDLILLDLVLPRMDGFKFLEELKKTDKKIPVIIASNLSQKEDIEKALDLGAVDYFVKSDTSINEVVRHIKNAL